MSDERQNDQPQSFEKWWESKGGDETFSGRLDCTAPGNLEDAKSLFQEAYEAGHQQALVDIKAEVDELTEDLVELAEEDIILSQYEQARAEFNLPEYWSSVYRKFVSDFYAADRRTLRHYNGRRYYSGPAVIVPRNELVKAIRETTVLVRWDEMGVSDLALYPE